MRLPEGKSYATPPSPWNQEHGVDARRVSGAPANQQVWHSRPTVVSNRGPLAFAAFRVRSFRFQWSADLLTSCAFEMETLILGR